MGQTTRHALTKMYIGRPCDPDNIIYEKPRGRPIGTATTHTRRDDTVEKYTYIFMQYMGMIKD